ncbi:hypothetical protein [Brachyspira pilosicoli]|uniref:hypothetical protein n=1 Tax=Brachyspira pilosicoli TaxID=52584 RepID=UPI00300459EA
MKQIFYMVLIGIFIIFSIILRYPKEDKNYTNLDATYHTLLTVKAYNEIPIKEHKFLPIVTLGGYKNVSWGATLPDKNGNFYYTSFSFIGYIAPYIFFKLFNLPITIYSLYLFNSILMIISCLLFYYIIYYYFSRYIEKKWLFIIVCILYLGTNEVIHSQGVIYWHHSLFQIFFLLHIISFIKLNNKYFKIVFWVLFFINPYIEWTGYISNFSFFIFFIIKLIFSKDKKYIKYLLIISILTSLSFLVFSLHYLLNINSKDYINAMISRFKSRNFFNPISIKYLFYGYYDSYKNILGIIIVSFAISFIFIPNSIKYYLLSLKKYSKLLFLLFIPILENLLMKEHAILYTFDRLKVIFFLITVLLIIFIHIYKNNKKLFFIIFNLIFIIQFINIFLYQNNTKYSFNIDYNYNNTTISQYVKSNFNNAILYNNTYVRGYFNILFDKNIYEMYNFNTVYNYFCSNTNNILIYINSQPSLWQIHKINKCVILNYKYASILYIDNYKLIEKKYNIDNLVWLYNLTDENWTKGISNFDNRTLLFINHSNNNILLNKNISLTINQNEYYIDNIEYKDDKYIHVKLKQNIDIDYIQELQPIIVNKFK